eukprot:CAMPEP_0175086794 /NCGR_PEP_ID=MMETSP0052_2-20121109/29457_1 /TAXON_ID=51329 ORGANISM="Polytomella parva, Strain SAG 63-3" /NCGR_SAMPLE_ID=MMETSP0052_2 /ASSEMBLY_ACC=CAM_ASM_000194 /LENGTH=371 /DNA_ID=CAMNT_0016359037 /DNA_START=259 /DNA_END=1374 /DNA_ORIENTATION=-
MGGPSTVKDVEPFLYNLFNDPDIIRMPPVANMFQPIVAKIISSTRASKSAKGYESIGGGSPLYPLTKDQGDALQNSLEKRGISAKMYIGMRYWHPFTEDSIKQIKADGITKLVALPLYPQYSISTTGSSLRCIRDEFNSDPYLSQVPLAVISRFSSRPGYIQSMADLVQLELKKFQNPSEVHIFFTAHGVPKKYVTDFLDPYQQEMEECVSLIMADLKARGVSNSHLLAYQSRVGPTEWLKPYTSEAIPALGALGCKGLLAVPISFVSEHIETLDEIDEEYRELALHSGIKEWGRVPALCSYPPFIEDLADAVQDAFSDTKPIVERNVELDGKPDNKVVMAMGKVLRTWQGQVAAVSSVVGSSTYLWSNLF